MTRDRRLLTLLGALYLAQGLPFGFFTQALPVMLREAGVSLERIGLASLLAAPWALKFLVAPWVDGTRSRRLWVLVLQLSGAALLILASALEPGWLPALLVVVFLVNAVAASQDIATDAIAVDALPPSRRGLANALQVGAYRVGMIIGGGALLVAFEWIGWSGVFLAMAAMTLLTTLPVSRWREPPRVPTKDAPSLAGFFRRADAAPLLTVLFLFKFGEAFGVAMLKPALVDFGASLSDVGVLVGTFGFVAGLLGAVVGGLLVNRLGRRSALLGFGALQACAVLAYAFIDRATAWRDLAAIVSFEHFAGGLATTTLFTCIMDWCRPGHSATDATVQASTVVVATLLASAGSGFSAQTFGHHLHFVLAAFLAMGAVVASALLLKRVHPKEAPCASPSTPAASTP
ncbi:MAG: MFS transporter [Myxococcaceae bacterium]|nr:MFS transporter [Myxococcaceae bacterium]